MNEPKSTEPQTHSLSKYELGRRATLLSILKKSYQKGG